MRQQRPAQSVGEHEAKDLLPDDQALGHGRPAASLDLRCGLRPQLVHDVVDRQYERDRSFPSSSIIARSRRAVAVGQDRAPCVVLELGSCYWQLRVLEFGSAAG